MVIALRLGQCRNDNALLARLGLAARSFRCFRASPTRGNHFPLGRRYKLPELRHEHRQELLPQRSPGQVTFEQHLELDALALDGDSPRLDLEDAEVRDDVI